MLLCSDKQKEEVDNEEYEEEEELENIEEKGGSLGRWPPNLTPFDLHVWGSGEMGFLHGSTMMVGLEPNGGALRVHDMTN